MAFEITIKDKISAIISIFNSKNLTECTLSISPNKKFSDIKEYVESGKVGTSLVGKISKQTDSGYIYEYEYIFDGKSMSHAGGYRVRINHMGEKVSTLSLFMRYSAATYNTKYRLNSLEKEVPDIPEGEIVDTEVVPSEDYSTKELNELIDVFDKKLTEFGKKATLGGLEELCKIKDAMTDKVNLKPLAERAPFSKAIGNMTTYLDALKMQMGSPLANATQFVGVYLPQIQTALSELAALL